MSYCYQVWAGLDGMTGMLGFSLSFSSWCKLLSLSFCCSWAWCVSVSYLLENMGTLLATIDSFFSSSRMWLFFIFNNSYDLLSKFNYKLVNKVFWAEECIFPIFKNTLNANYLTFSLCQCSFSLDYLVLVILDLSTN